MSVQTVPSPPHSHLDTYVVGVYFYLVVMMIGSLNVALTPHPNSKHSSTAAIVEVDTLEKSCENTIGQQRYSVSMEYKPFIEHKATDQALCARKPKASDKV